MVQVSKVKKVFNDEGIQMSAEGMNMIREDFMRHIRLMAKRCKEGNVKRLSPDTYHLALGKYENYL
tara:strand:+ start:935 stop:1132 length:198 start_codon:yes stop_codon:yes gene_type:complete